MMTLPAGVGERAPPRDAIIVWRARRPRCRSSLIVVVVALGQSQSVLTSTNATRFTPLQASSTSPSGVPIMWRTMPPPEGMIHVWNCSVLVSNRTSVFGLTPDSLYQTTWPVEAMP